MYKVFIDDTPIILTDSLNENNNFLTQTFKEELIDEIIYKLKSGKINGINLFSKDLEKDWALFKSHFKIIIAAGGLVFNKKDEILFICRANKWDLPKGRLEEGEDIQTTALREVEEECGITHLTIVHFLTTTYHFFVKKREKRIKETHWFLMHSDFNGTLTPQREEGITKAVFKNKIDTENALKNTYANIILVHETHHENQKK